MIQAMLPTHSLRQIATALGRSPATISREVARNSWRPSHLAEAYRPYRPARLKTDWWTGRAYVASRAEAAARSRHHGRRARMSHDPLVAYVTERLRRGWSPLVISGRLRLDHPDDERMRACPETIYAWIYVTQDRAAGLSGYLARAHRRRRHTGGRRTVGSPIRLRVGVSHRPKAADERSQAGHWEADSVICKHGVIHTLVDRATRFMLTALLPDKTAAATSAAQTRLLDGLPTHMRRTITYDNGSEFAAHHTLVESHGVLTYFADPYSSWQRGTNENRNGVLRRYLPKGTDITHLDPTELADITTEINNRPLRVLGYHTPAEAHQQALTQHTIKTTNPRRCTST